MKKVLLAAAALACIGGTALAGPNANGSLIVALADGVVYTTDIENYCGATGLQNCADASVSTAGDATVVIGILAAFPSVASPRLSGVTFGWTYDDNDVALAGYGPCGDFELATGGWPASGEGTAVTWGAAQTGTIVDVYWVAAANYYGNAQTLDLIAHPSQGAMFADDDVPSNLDMIAALGSFGFDTEGTLPCPTDVAPGACCAADGSCEVVLREDCQGEFLGDGTDCDPNMCIQPAEGACCVGEVCSIRTAMSCDENGGNYQGDDTVCDPNPCTVVPVIDSTWGTLKNNYR
ncbi:MAG: hypothetical protein KDA27_25765 [Candidatus Eisenbacteria bacterium]|uniref:Uncharacterized protein n=1 Tax=Eiseniibacteriota bacterium TaxID=2212470 RepID=A0A956NK22_UNCEI|nr:hypothetical protein [Candidatus Eisenbacteria bacterium]MCB9463154.1 hypothetical protein [Candidatus Eisenbacteria bacterium]